MFFSDSDSEKKHPAVQSDKEYSNPSYGQAFLHFKCFGIFQEFLDCSRDVETLFPKGRKIGHNFAYPASKTFIVLKYNTN